MKSKSHNHFLFFLIFFLILNLFHFYNFFIFPFGKTNFLTSIPLDQNIYFFVIIFFIFFHQKSLLYFDKTLLYMILILIYSFLLEFRYEKNFLFLDNNYSYYREMFRHLTKIVISYYIIGYLFENIAVKKIHLSIKLTFIFFSLIILFYSFSIIYFEQLYRSNFFSFLNLSEVQESSFTNNIMISIYSFLFYLTIKLTKKNSHKLIFSLIFILIFLFYFNLTSSRTGFVILVLTIFFLFYDNLKKKKKILWSILILLIVFSFSFERFSKKISKEILIFKSVSEIINNDENLVFNENLYKKQNLNELDFGSVESSTVRYGTIIYLFKKMTSKFENMIFGISYNETMNLKVNGYSLHSLVLSFIFSYGLVIFLTTLILFFLGIGKKNFRYSHVYYCLIYLAIITLSYDKMYSHYVFIIYILLNNDKFYKKNL